MKPGARFAAPGPGSRPKSGGSQPLGNSGRQLNTGELLVGRLLRPPADRRGSHWGDNMKSATSLALAMAAGYCFGRKRKLRLAVLLGTALATGKAGRFVGDALQRNLAALGPDTALGHLAPDVGKLSGVITDEFVGAGKAAAKAAVTSRVDALADRIHDRAEAIRSGGQPHAGDDGEDRSGQRVRSQIPGQRRASPDRKRETAGRQAAGHARSEHKQPTRSQHKTGSGRPAARPARDR
jgi:hypothetical protein